MPDNVMAGGGLDDIRINLGEELALDETTVQRHVNQEKGGGGGGGGGMQRDIQQHLITQCNIRLHCAHCTILPSVLYILLERECYFFIH